MHTNTRSLPGEIVARWAGEAADLLVDLEPLSCAADGDLMAVALAVEGARRTLDVVSTAVLGELHARGTTEIADGLSTARWLADRTGCSTRQARRRVRVADTVRRDLPATEEALRAGLSETAADATAEAASASSEEPSAGVPFGFDHAAVLAGVLQPRIAHELRLLEPELVAMAAEMTFEAWRTHVTCVAALLDQDGGYDPNDDVSNNRLSVQPHPDGTIVSGTLVGATAVTVAETLDQVTGELLRRHRADAEATGCEVPSLRTLRALALAEICHRALRSSRSSGSEPRVEASLVVHADDLDRVYDSNDICHRRAALGSLLCDAEVTAIVLDSLGVPLDVGRAERLFNRAQRRAMARRDGGCVFPGCGAPSSGCQAHHVDWWESGGHTDLARGLSLCRHHHGVVHRRGWGIDITVDGWAVVTTPAGSRRWGQRHHRRRTGPLPPPMPQRA